MRKMMIMRRIRQTPTPIAINIEMKKIPHLVESSIGTGGGVVGATEVVGSSSYQTKAHL